MPAQILLIRYSYFELEGIPPYPSPFVPVDFSYVWWLDTKDTNRFRYEKRYSTRGDPHNSGLVESSVGTGAGGQTQNVSYWEDNPTCQETANPPNKVPLAEWLDAFTAMGRDLLNKHRAGNLAPYKYKGIETDNEWGQVHVFERPGKLQASDLYPGKPMVERFTFDVEQLRQVEMSRIVQTRTGKVLHRLYRLKRWLLLEREEIPANAFEKIAIGSP